MEQILELFKSYFAIAFILLIISYLAPKEAYRSYFQFFISILLAIILFQPLEEWIVCGKNRKETIDWKQIEEISDFNKYSEKLGEDIFECFGMEESVESRQEEKTK